MMVSQRNFASGYTLGKSIKFKNVHTTTDQIKQAIFQGFRKDPWLFFSLEYEVTKNEDILSTQEAKTF